MILMNPVNRCCLSGLAMLAASAAALSTVVPSARADVAFLGVAAGDASSHDAILWTRAVDTNAPAALLLTAQVSANDPNFSSNVLSFSVSTDINKDYVAKIAA